MAGEEKKKKKTQVRYTNTHTLLPSSRQQHMNEGLSGGGLMQLKLKLNMIHIKPHTHTHARAGRVSKDDDEDETSTTSNEGAFRKRCGF